MDAINRSAARARTAALPSAQGLKVPAVALRLALSCNLEFGSEE